MAPRPRFCVIADDLTGALDTAAPFASHGWRTLVVPWPGRARSARALAAVVERAWASSDVVVVDTASRHAAPREAARRVRAAVGAASPAFARAAAGGGLIKKIDSTLRGNVAAELASFRRAIGIACLPIAPAFPAQGRTTRGGAVLVDGRPLAASAAAHDAREPATAGQLARLAPAGTLDIFDAETDADLRRVARRLAAAGRLHGCVGAGGLATAIAATLGSRRRATDPRGLGTVLVVAGSAHPAAHAQVAALVADGALGLVVPMAARAARDLEATVLLAAGALDAGRSVVLAPPPLGSGTHVEARSADAVTRRLAAVVVRLVALAPVGAVLTVGGDTTAAVVAAAQWAPLHVAGAIVPGVALVALPAPSTRPRGHGAGPRWLVTKSGAFGDADTLRRLVRRLTTEPRRRPGPGRSASPR